MNRPLQWITTAVLGAAATLMTSFGLPAALLFLSIGQRRNRVGFRWSSWSKPQ